MLGNSGKTFHDFSVIAERTAFGRGKSLVHKLNFSFLADLVANLLRQMIYVCMWCKPKYF
jgi:hypothetical protein